MFINCRLLTTFKGGSEHHTDGTLNRLITHHNVE